MKTRRDPRLASTVVTQIQPVSRSSSLHLQHSVSLTGRNTTGPPCSVKWSYN